MNNQSLAERKYIIIGIFILIGLIYISRLFYIQVIDDRYKLDAKNQAFRYLTDYPVRGYIYDRNGKLLVYNEASYDLMVIPKQVKNLDTTAFCELIGITKESFNKRMLKAIQHPNSPRKPSIFEKQLTAKNYAAIQEKLYRFQGFYVQSRTLRNYPMKIAAHMLGYIGEISKKAAEKNPYYKEGDYIGISGIEKSYEEELRGKKGVRIEMVDVHNRPKGSFANGKYDTLSIPGKPLWTTIDADLQQYAELLMQNKRGSVVAIEPATGEILTIVTSPSYDPNLLVGRERSKHFSDLNKDTLRLPLFNRALDATYPPGSTFKLLDALIGQKEGVLTRETRFPCKRGYPPLGGRPKCHPHSSPLNLPESIQNSCNSYYSFAFKVIIENNKYAIISDGYNAWRDYLLSFNVGRVLGSDIPESRKGILPTRNYFDKVHGKNSWKASTIISLGIGQGELGITPLQNANVVAIIANRGFYYTPHIVKYIGTEKEANKKFLQKNYTKVTDTAYYNVVIEGMENAVKAGTATLARIDSIIVCGKTGTAQNKGKDHSVFVCFAPKENPKIAIAILVENAGWGGSYAAPIASLMIEKYLKGAIHSERRKELEKKMIETDFINAKPIIAAQDDQGD